MYIGEAFVFIDGPNLSSIVRNQYGDQDIDMPTFIGLLLDIEGRRTNYRIVRSYYYTTKLPQEKTYSESLQEIENFEVREGFVAGQKGRRQREKAVDVFLAVDMVRFAWLMNYKRAILVSGDGDFVPAVRAVKERAANVIVVCHEACVSKELLRTCDRFTPIDRYITKPINVAMARKQGS